ncbi:MAG TPA: S41 family peptidase [Flavobacteriales bacterium]|nr:S41 family peptidase [Flavobacteriales bacterium]
MAGVMLAVAGMAQGDPLGKVTWREGLQEDLGIIRQTLEQAHPDPYRYRTRTEVDQLFDGLSYSLDGSMTAEEFIRMVLPALQVVGDAGTSLAPPAALQRAYDNSVPMIPIHVSVIADRLYLDEEPKGFRSLPTGCEILAINGRPAERIVERLRNSQVREGNDTTLLDRRIERNFPEMYRRFVEAGDRFEVDYRMGDGNPQRKEVFAMTKEEMRRTYRPKGIELQPWRLEEFPGTRSAWLTLGTFEQAELERWRVNPERFLGNVADALRRSEATTLVIDVRGAQGSDMAMAARVFSLIAKKPFRMVGSMSIRSGRVPDSYRYAKPEPEFFAAVGGLYAAEVNGRRELLAEDARLKYQDPLPKAFTGKVYVVCDGGTTGAAAAFVMAAKRTGRARTVGEETGSNASSFCGGRTLEVTLPNSGCILTVPLTRFVPEGVPAGPVDRGEMPSYQVPRLPQDLIYGKDTVREALMLLIAEMQ